MSGTRRVNSAAVPPRRFGWRVRQWLPRAETGKGAKLCAGDCLVWWEAVSSSPCGQAGDRNPSRRGSCPFRWTPLLRIHPSGIPGCSPGSGACRPSRRVHSPPRWFPKRPARSRRVARAQLGPQRVPEPPQCFRHFVGEARNAFDFLNSGEREASASRCRNQPANAGRSPGDQHIERVIYTRSHANRQIESFDLTHR